MKFAYLDPGSGSMILQVILGGLAAAAVFLKMFWHRLLLAVKIRKSEASTRRAETADTESTPL
jgi:hypothetical protein